MQPHTLYSWVFSAKRPASENKLNKHFSFAPWKTLDRSSLDRKSFWLTTMLLIGIVGVVNGQRNEKTPASQFSRHIVTPTPGAAQLGIFGNLTPDFNTGAAKLSIPLFEAKSRQLSLPIALNYHCTGLVANQISSWVGLGWVLNTGGIITRTVRGFADELPNGYLHGGWTQTRLLHQGQRLVQGRQKEVWYSLFLNSPEPNNRPLSCLNSQFENQITRQASDYERQI